MPVIRQDRIYPKDCRLYPERLFVFGDNMARKGKAGQAIIRDELNAVGIPTKHWPSTIERAYFEDVDIRSPWLSGTPTMVKRAIDDAFERLEARLRAGGVIVLPSDGIGTGLAELPTRAPKIFAYIQERIATLEKI